MMIKKTFIAICAASLLAAPVLAEDQVSGTASSAEETASDAVLSAIEEDESAYAVTSSVNIENGVMTIYLDEAGAPKAGFSWTFLSDTEDDDEYIIELITETDQDGHAYVGSFRAIKDGKTAIRLIHTNGTYIDMYMDLEVTAEGGEITENPGGGCVYAATAADLAPQLEGIWTEQDGTARLEFSPSDDGGFYVNITDDTGSYTMTAYSDALYDAMLYTNGTSPERPEVSETPAPDGTTGETGAFILNVENEDSGVTEILWRNDASESGDARIFVRGSN